MKFKIDYGTYDVAFPPTGSWTKWDTVYIDDVWLDALDFKLKIESTVANGGPNIDMIAFNIKGVYRTGCGVPSKSNAVDEDDSTKKTDPADSGKKKVQTDSLSTSIGHKGVVGLTSVPSAKFNALGQKVHSESSRRHEVNRKTFLRRKSVTR